MVSRLNLRNNRKVQVLDIKSIGADHKSFSFSQRIHEVREEKTI